MQIKLSECMSIMAFKFLANCGCGRGGSAACADVCRSSGEGGSNFSGKSVNIFSGQPLRAVEQFPIPHDVKSVHRLLGLTSFFR